MSAPSTPAPNAFRAVIVTGGSSGIGKSFLEHARKICSPALLCNLSRRDPREKIEPPAQQLDLCHIRCDLADPAQLAAAARQVIEQLERTAPTGRILLVNNAGFGGYGRVSDLAAAHQLGMIDVNVRAVVDLTARLLPVILQRGGAIINVASTAGFQPTPYLSTYGATKAFVLHWSLALAEEVRARGVRVLAVCPGPTKTAFFQRAGATSGGDPGASGQTSGQVVREAMAALEAGRSMVVTGWRNKLMTAVASKLPKAGIARVAARLLARTRLQPPRGA